MRLSVETAVGIGAMLTVQLVTAFAAVGLLARTSPAIELVLRENASIAAVEQALGVLATSSDPVAFDRAITVVRERSNDPEEGPLLERAASLRQEALAGDPLARAELVATLRELSALDRATMEELDEEARFIGRAGAWTTAMLGGVGFLLSIIVYRRFRARIEEPIVAIDGVLQSVRSGGMRRRCSTHEGPVEARRIAENVNWLIDRHEQEHRGVPESERTDRSLLVAVLDRSPEPVVALDQQGRPLAVNKAALALWDQAGDPTAELALATREGAEPVPGWTIEPVPTANAWLCRKTG